MSLATKELLGEESLEERRWERIRRAITGVNSPRVAEQHRRALAALRRLPFDEQIELLRRSKAARDAN